MNNVIDFSVAVPYAGQLRGLVTVPTGFEPEKEKLPVIVFLHGLGERDDGTKETLELLKRHGIPKYFCENPDYKGLRVITVSPQCPGNYTWSQMSNQLMDYINAAIEKFGGDPARVAVTGLSMGGFGTWSMITQFPDYFYRAAPICGGGAPGRARNILPGMKIRVFHSIDDDAVPYECSVLMTKEAIKAGADIEFTTYCREGHGSWNKAYGDTDLIEWLAGGALCDTAE